MVARKPYQPKFNFGTIAIVDGAPICHDDATPDDTVLVISAVMAEWYRSALDGVYERYRFDPVVAEKACDAWAQCYWAAKAWYAERGITSRTKWLLVSVHVLKGGGLRANTNHW
jgi:hypothetical protein